MTIRIHRTPTRKERNKTKEDKNYHRNKRRSLSSRRSTSTISKDKKRTKNRSHTYHNQNNKKTCRRENEHRIEQRGSRGRSHSDSSQRRPNVRTNDSTEDVIKAFTAGLELLGTNQLDMDKLKSKRQDAKAWFEHFEKFTKAYEWSREKMATILPTMLSGPITSIWNEIPKEDRKSYSRQKDFLIKKLTRYDREEIKMKFYSMSQKDDESCENFAQRLRDTYLKAFNSDEREVNYSKTIIKRFLRGTKLTIQVSLSTQRWDKQSSAVSAAAKIEKCLRRSERKYKLDDSDREISSINYVRKCEVETKNPIPKPFQSSEQSKDQNIEANGQSSERPNDNANFEIEKKGVGLEGKECFGCHQIGHQIRECPNRSCYKCGKLGHLSYNCPLNLNTSKARGTLRRN